MLKGGVLENILRGRGANYLSERRKNLPEEPSSRGNYTHEL